MKRLFGLAAMLVICLTAVVGVTAQSSNKVYREMSPAEQQAFIDEAAARIARELSGREYRFTPAFGATIRQGVDSYVKRIGRRDGKEDAAAIFARGESLAPTLIAAFNSRRVSPLIGLYLPLIESNYNNLQSQSPMGAVGMFQFLPQTGKRFGLTKDDLMDVRKSAEAAARYIAESTEFFKDDSMKEALALLAYNRGNRKVMDDLSLVLDDGNRGCSICALTENSKRLDPTFQNESVYYVPMFFAAAIVGENPLTFGLKTQPLSSLDAQ